MMDMDAADYLLGHNDRERRRLALQAAILNPLSEQLFHRAGISRGMNVLDLGCGVGDISLLVSRLVGANGRVIGIDIDEAAISECRVRAQQTRATNLTFDRCAIDDFVPQWPIDAVVGRLILIHVRDRPSALKKVFSILKPGGVAAFHEPDFTLPRPFPTTPLGEQFWKIVYGVFGPMRPDFAVSMPSMLLDAGFSSPQCVVEIPADFGPQSQYYEWYAETWLSLQTPAQKLGIQVAAESDASSLIGRFRDEFVASHLPIFSAVMVGGFALKP